MSTDPIHLLAHDHADINRCVLALGTALEQLEREPGPTPRTLTALLDQLRETLFLHFAREEEGLFPFVSEAFPELADTVLEMETAHDAICGGIARMCDLVATNAALSGVLPVFRRFENAYARHARTEAKLLESLESRLDSEQRKRLSALVEGL